VAVIGIIDYGMGNLRSVQKGFERVGATAEIVTTARQIEQADKVVLPGVGAFDRGMEALSESGIAEALSVAALERGVPILGICLGMQLMTKRSEEGRLPGLGWLDAEVVKFRFPEGSGLKIPHMGWNTLSIRRENPLIRLEERQRFYFVHSYHVVCTNEPDVTATCGYGYDFVAAFAHNNIFGAQFHPEKSHRFGMSVMRNFLEMKTC
jgi:glutamine amidotransferase